MAHAIRLKQDSIAKNVQTQVFELETPYAEPHVRCCERCDAKTSAYSITRLSLNVFH